MATMWMLNSWDNIRSAAANNPATHLDPRIMSGGTSGPETPWHSGHRIWSGVFASLLAACHQDETAREVTFADGTVRGHFSDSLVTWLWCIPLENTTYRELLNRLPTWSGQSPCCEGININQLIFNGNYPAAGRHAMPMIVRTSPNTTEPDFLPSFTVLIGSVEGVIPGTEFSVYDSSNSFVGKLVAHSVNMNETILVPLDESAMMFPEGARAVATDWKEAMVLHVYLASNFPYKDVLFPTKEIARQPRGRKFVQAATLDTVEIALHAGGDEVIVERLTSIFLECACETHLVLRGNPKHLPAVLNRIAHFNYFLKRHHGSAPLDSFTLEMYQLMGDFPGSQLDPSVGNMITLQKAQFRYLQTARYGFTLWNDSEDDLFPYLFYFDPLSRRVFSLVIMPHFMLTLVLEEGKTSSSGFLKLFVSMEHLDLAWIKQTTSPFNPEFTGTGRLAATREPFVQVPRWDALHVVLVVDA
ncbi:hypothetical protein B0H13DRAFT_2384565 [Mycena leptocephala]|nr:hypothetical protein B0H13DRAFT_2384565 [Mycena leptocephala]